MTRTVTAMDAFCGAGGTSTGLALACADIGAKVDLLAINHWKVAVETHRLNHPDARHLESRVESVRPRDAFPGGRLNLLVASPECTHHSTARGGRPVSDQLRASAHHLIPWLDELRVDAMLVENVPEFVSWCRVGSNGRPVKKEKGAYFRDWIRTVRGRGYNVEWRIMNSADYGDATSRRRLFVMARRGGRPIVWPIPNFSRGGRVPGTRAWRAAREIIDWSLKGRSIFERELPLAPRTLARITEELRRFGGTELRPFLVLMEHGGGVRSVERPLPTVTTARGGSMGVAEPFTIGVVGRNLKPASVDDPLPTITQRTSRWVVETEVAPFTVSTDRPETNRSLPRSVEEPIAMVVANKERIALTEAFILSQASGGAPRSVGEPVPTIPAGGAHALVDASFVLPPLGFYARDGKANPPRSPDDPLQTLTQRGGGHLVEPFITEFHGGGGGDRRVRSLEEPLPTQDTANRFGIAEPFIIANFGEREGQAPRTHAIDTPLPAVTSRGAGTLVEPFLTTYYRNGGVTSIEDPAPVVTTRDRIALVQPVIDGRALDIRFRMLEPRELAAAMGFPKDYAFTGTRTDIVRQIGNAVSVQLARALCKSLLSAPSKPPADTIESYGSTGRAIA